MAEENADQVAFWGGDAGDTWVAHQAMMDSLLTPVLDGVLARADLTLGQHVLDVGCGTGHSTVAAGDLVGAQGDVRGADVSETMLALARARAKYTPQVSFDCVDVADHAFGPARFDSVISRFGVMFFADTTAAFANIAHAMKPDARMVFATWGRIEANPWFTLPARIGKETFGPVPKSDPDAPGPFALRDITKVEGILHAAGLRSVKSEAVDLNLSLSGGPRDIARLCLHIGPAARTLAHFEADQVGRQRLEGNLTQAFSELEDQSVPAEINFFTCTL